MGKGIDLARDEAPLHAALLDDLKDQLLIVFIKRLGNKVSIDVSEIDNTGGYVCMMNVDSDTGKFNFEVRPKQ